MSNSYEHFMYLAGILFSGPAKGRRVIFVAPYIDESGTHALDAVLTLSGYLSTVEKWGAFTDTWDRILADLAPWQSESQDYFHMAQFASNRHPYEKFANNPDDKAKFAKRIFAAIKNTREYGFSVALREVDYNAVVDLSLREQLGHAYTCCAQWCLAMVGDWIEGYETQTAETIAPVVYTFEDGAAHEKEAKAFLSMVAKNAELKAQYRYKNRAFIPKSGNPPLQAADVLACETHRELTRTVTGKSAKGDYYLEDIVADPYDKLITLNRGQIRQFVEWNLDKLTNP